MTRLLMGCLLCCCLVGLLSAQGLLEEHVSQLELIGSRVLVGTPSGLIQSEDLGEEWTNIYPAPGVATVTAIAGQGDTLLIGFGYNQSGYTTSVPAGAGLALSVDSGRTFISVTPSRNQASDIYQLAYNTAITPNRLWAACFWGGLIVSTDGGTTWWNQIMDGSLDTLDTEISETTPERLFFSMTTDDQPVPWIWAGTQAGIWRSTDNGSTWNLFQYATSGLTADFAVTMAVQHYGDRRLLWTSTRPINGAPGYVGLSIYDYQAGAWITATERDGLINTRYDSTLAKPSLNVWDIAFQDSIVYVAATEGLYRTTDWGHSWEEIVIRDPATGNRSLAQRANRVVTGMGGLWVATEDGLWLSTDGGVTWRQLGTHPHTEGMGVEHACIAYPSPFRPGTDFGGCKIAFTSAYGGHVTIRIYDDAMEPVRDLALDDPTPSQVPGELVRYWDGLDNRGRAVDNGVYHIRITFTTDEECWVSVGVIN